LFGKLLFALLSLAAGTVDQYSVPEKLSTLDKCAIASLAQDSKGALWMTTGQGLFRYDGAELVCFDSGAREAPLCVHGDNLFYGSTSGIVRIGPSGTVRYLNERNFNALVSIIATDGQELSVCFAHRVMTAQGDSLLVTAMTGAQSGRITAAVYYQGDLIVGTASGNIFKVDGSEVTNLYRCSSGVCAFHISSSGHLWVGLSEGGILRTGDITFADVETSEGETPRDVRCFCEDPSGGIILLGTIDGLYSIDENLRIIRDPSHAPSGHAIKAILCDNDGTIWAGTHYNGVVMFNPHSPVSYVYGSHDYARLINAIVEDDRSRIWTATDHYGLYVHDKGGRRLIPGTTEKKFKAAVWNVGTLWLGEYMGGISAYLPESGRWRHFGYTDANGEPMRLSTYAMAVRDDVIFLGTNNGLYIFDPAADRTITRKVHGTEKKVIYSLDASPDGTVWIGSTGLYSYSAEGMLDSVEQLEGEKCRSVDATDDRIFTAVQGKGFCTIDEDGVGWYTSLDCGMSSKEVYVIRAMSDSTAAAGTSEGISFVNLRSGECVNYDPPLWAGTGTFLDGCITAIAGDRLWAGGSDGIVEIDPERISFKVNEHPLVFDRLELNGEDRSYLLASRTIRIPHHLNNVTLTMSDFNLAGLKYTDNLVVSKELNIHEEGVRSGYSLNVSTLKRGLYNVSVSSRSVPFGEILSEETKRLRVLPPWYSSIPALLGYMLVFLLLVYVSYKKYLDQKRMYADLEAKYSSLLEIQKKYWTGAADASQVAGNEKDADFLQEISTFVESSIGVTDISVSLLCEHVCMGRTVFTEKIKELTGMPPRDFIEATKLKKAARMLSAGGKTISEIAYELGFNSPKYFSIRFRKQFGESPSEWMKR